MKKIANSPRAFLFPIAKLIFTNQAGKLHLAAAPVLAQLARRKIRDTKRRFPI
jgi:hypothetical protein